MNTTLKLIEFSNMFSYGSSNNLLLDKNKITQLTAQNGSGKSSIALILQEILYNKNIKGVKKGDILNRWSNSKNWKGAVEFDTDDNSYRVEVQRTGASTKVKLLENGIDISEHKVLDTYKKINSIIGLDFEVFSQLTYQSSTDLLDFLKATDANRKKFLINLFNLEKYLEIGDNIKVASSATDKQLNELQGELRSVEDFLNNTKLSEPREEKPLPKIDSSLSVRISEIDSELSNITEITKRIDKNNMYISERDELSFDVSLQEPEVYEGIDELEVLKHEKIGLSSELNTLKREVSSIKILDKCPSCGQDIDNNHLVAMKAKLDGSIKEKENELFLLNQSISSMQRNYDKYQQVLEHYTSNRDKILRFEQLTQLIDSSIPTEYPNADNLKAEKQKLQLELDSQQDIQKTIIDFNKQVSAHNAKIEAVKEQISDFKVRQDDIKKDILNKSDVATSLNILKKAFSTSGIVAFKLESLTKELETTINQYLASLSDGQFQVEFSLEKEKLNISVINNGIASPIETMSGGEFSRIQTSILLAIRNLLSKLGGSSVNLLFLDEIMAVLDDDGKEGLINVLMLEKDLNVFLISHEYENPLIPKIGVIKNENISKLLQY